jgi:hypothetical protein
MDINGTRSEAPFSTSNVVNAIVGVVTIIGAAVCAIDRINKETRSFRSKGTEDSPGDSQNA